MIIVTAVSKTFVRYSFRMFQILYCQWSFYIFHCSEHLRKRVENSTLGWGSGPSHFQHFQKLKKAVGGGCQIPSVEFLTSLISITHIFNTFKKIKTLLSTLLKNFKKLKKNSYVKNAFQTIISLPYFGVKLSCVCLMLAYRKK